MYDRHGNIKNMNLREQLAKHLQIKEMEQEYVLARADRYAPKYHYYSVTPSRKLNDPNGLCLKDGVFHMFYQQWPYKGSKLHWGHVISRDMVRWTELPTAISPGKDNGAWSGTTLVEDDRVLAMYYGFGLGNMIAESTDNYLVEWKRISEDPVVPIIPVDENGIPYRVFDPCIWKEGNEYYAISGAYTGPKQKMIRGMHRMMPYLFHSTDLLHWDFLGEFMPDNPFYSMGEDCACPYFFPLGSKYMLMHFSHTSSSHILVGDYNRLKHIFIPTLHQQLSAGEICHFSGGLGAGTAMPDREGGAYAIFNLKDGLINHTEHDGMMTLPWNISFNDTEDALRIKPYCTVDSLRTYCHDVAMGSIKPFETNTIYAAGNCIEIAADIDMKNARTIILCVLCSDDKREHTDISITRRPENREKPIGSYPYIPDQTARVYLSLDRTSSSLREDIWPRAVETLDTVIPIDEAIKLRVFIDVCTVEVFMNDRLVISQTVYPSLAGSQNVDITAIGGEAFVEKMNIWQMEHVI